MFDILYMHTLRAWKFSSAGRASALQAEGHRFEPYNFHQKRRPRGLFFIAEGKPSGARWWKATRFCRMQVLITKPKKKIEKSFFYCRRQAERSEGWKATRFCRMQVITKPKKKIEKSFFYCRRQAERSEGWKATRFCRMQVLLTSTTCVLNGFYITRYRAYFYFKSNFCRQNCRQIYSKRLRDDRKNIMKPFRSLLNKL